MNVKKNAAIGETIKKANVDELRTMVHTARTAIRELESCLEHAKGCCKSLSRDLMKANGKAAKLKSELSVERAVSDPSYAPMSGDSVVVFKALINPIPF